MMGAPPERILLVQLKHLGDVLLATPAIRAARATFPNARIDFLTGAPGAQALEGNPHLDEILVAPRLARLYRSRYDAVADMHSVPRSALYVAATRARVRIGIRGRGPRNLAYTRLLPREPDAVYMALQKTRVLAPLGVDAEAADLALEIAIGEADHAWAGRIVAPLRAPVVAVSPVARHSFKQWGIERWASVADALAERGASVMLTSGPGEQEQVVGVAARMTRQPLWQYGPTTVRQLAALYRRCVLWLGNDGGPKHIAAAAGTPTISVVRRNLGPVWNDLRAGSGQIAFSSGSDDLDSISPDQIIQAALPLIGRIG